MEKIKKNNLVPLLLIAIAAFFRLYRIPEFVTFLGDQGRDAIIIRRILTFEHFPAIGAPSSIGGVYLGPFYYYLISPFLLLSGFNPVGLAYGVAILSIIGTALCYYITKKSTNDSIALLLLAFITFSSVNIDLSRFSWNPNLLPVFAFLTLYFFIQLIEKQKVVWALLFGAFLSFSIQLHYLALLLCIPASIFFIYFVINNSKKIQIKKWIILISSSITSFLVFISPLIIFDLRHNFLNANNLLNFFTNQNPSTKTSLLVKLHDTFASLLNHSFKIELPLMLVVAMYITLAITLYHAIKNKKQLVAINILNVFTFVLAFSFLESARHPHYYGPVYFSLFLGLAYLLALNNSKTLLILAVSFMSIFIYTNSKHYIFLLGKESNQISRAKKYADSIYKNIAVEPYQLTSLPPTESDGHIRYFLEISGKRPLTDNSIEEPKELFVLCYEPKCEVLGNSQWQIAIFKDAKIEDTWKVENVTIYKLIHEK